MWLEIFRGVYFCRLAIFCVLRELIVAIRTDWFLLLGINFRDFQNPVPSICGNLFFRIAGKTVKIRTGKNFVPHGRLIVAMGQS